MGLREGGFSFSDTVKRLGQNVSTVHDCWVKWSRYITGSRRPGSRWPRCPTESKDRSIQHPAVAHHTASQAKIRAALCTTVTQRTLKNRFLQRQFRARRPVACIPLTPSHCHL
ncbi:transposable element Tc1 transposase [Trichonephila clavipes]|nr:transposable element Tc1 transposase [Trichonephila clavipes]